MRLESVSKISIRTSINVLYLVLMLMALIYETRHFIVESHEKPFVDYEDG